MWGSIIGAGISAAAGLIGASKNNAATANLNRQNRKWQASEQRKGEKRNEEMVIRAERRETQRMRKFTDPAFIRKRAEKAGFNPLLFTGQAAGYGGVGTGAGGFSQGAPAFAAIGDNGIADAGASIGRGFASLDQANLDAEYLSIEKSRLEMEQARMTEIIDNMRFRPSSGGFLNNGSPSDPELGQTEGPGGSTLNAATGIYESMDDARRGVRATGGNPMDPPTSIEERERDPSAGQIHGDGSRNTRRLPDGTVRSYPRPGLGQGLEDDAGEMLGALEMIPWAWDRAKNHARGGIYEERLNGWVFDQDFEQGGRFYPRDYLPPQPRPDHIANPEQFQGDQWGDNPNTFWTEFFHDPAN